MWKLQPTRVLKRYKDFVDTVGGSSTPIRGVLRDRLRKVPNWELFRACVMRMVQEELVKNGVEEPYLSQMVNNPASFGAADTSVNAANRWATDFAPCVASDTKLMNAWNEVKSGIENELLPQLTDMIANTGFTNKIRFFEGSQLKADNDYTCIRHGIMVDPVDSAVQKSHIDISNEQLKEFVGSFNIWNIFIPIQVEYGHPETAVHGNNPASKPFKDVNIGLYDVFFFDGMRSHFGRGNTHTVPRILLHLVYVQTKLLQHPLGREEISQQYQKNGTNVPPDQRNIFDGSTLVGKSGVSSKLVELGIRRSKWEEMGGLDLEGKGAKNSSWKKYSEVMQEHAVRRDDRVDSGTDRERDREENSSYRNADRVHHAALVFQLLTGV